MKIEKFENGAASSGRPDGPIDLKFFYTSSVALYLAGCEASFSIQRLWDLIGLIEVSDYKNSKMLENKQKTYENGALDAHNTKTLLIRGHSRSIEVT